MVVAKQKQYYQNMPDRRQNKDSGLKRAARDKGGIMSKRRAVVRVILAFAIGILTISRFAIISEYNYNIRNMEKELGELFRVNERLQIQHARVMDINWIEDHALHRLGMIYPESRDIVYVAVEKEGGMPLIADIPEEEKRNAFYDGDLFAFLISVTSRIFQSGANVR